MEKAWTITNPPGHLLNALDDAFNMLDTREPFGEGFYDSIRAHEALRAKIEAAGPPWMPRSSPPATPTSTWPGCGP